jgi:hypothetical protein
MRYRVAFAKRFETSGQASAMDPTTELDVYLADGVVAEKRFVERLEPAAQHSQEVLDEDDAFLASATPEVWEYEVVDSRKDEFEDAAKNAEGILEIQVVDETETSADEATGVLLSRNEVRRRETGAQDTELRGGAGVSATPDDGPAGRPTVDASAGGMAPGRSRFGDDEVEGIGEPGGAGIDDLRVADASDPSLGLTEPGDPDSDWAANTGPTRAPGRGIETRDLTDRSSTLRQMPSPSPKRVEKEAPPQAKPPRKAAPPRPRAKKPRAGN